MRFAPYTFSATLMLWLILSATSFAANVAADPLRIKYTPACPYLDILVSADQIGRVKTEQGRPLELAEEWRYPAYADTQIDFVIERFHNSSPANFVTNVKSFLAGKEPTMRVVDFGGGLVAKYNTYSKRVIFLHQRKIVGINKLVAEGYNRLDVEDYMNILTSRLINLSSEERPIFSENLVFFNQKLLEEHFAKHKEDTLSEDPNDYVAGANAVLQHPSEAAIHLLAKSDEPGKITYTKVDLGLKAVVVVMLNFNTNEVALLTFYGFRGDGIETNINATLGLKRKDFKKS